tara:strand:- start:3552 stop:4580 length:1029 start_codon:yes stop_codon:yes gene_type:complete
MNESYEVLLKSLAIFISGTIISFLAAKFINVVLSRIASRTKSETDDYIVETLTKTIRPIGITISVYIATNLLNINQSFNELISVILKLILIIIIIRFTNKISLKLLIRWSNRINDSSLSAMIRSLSPMLRAFIWSLGSLFYLQNIGVQMAAIWALLSAGGIGAGLALKEPVQEFFEYITILLDKPFQNGEFINIDNIWATVERVGVRSTRLRSINGEIIVMSNSALTNGTIANYAEMDYRRLVHKIGVIYDTSIDKMKIVPSIIEEIIGSTKDAIFDRCHFTDFANFSLDFEFVYYIPTNDYIRAMKAQELINLEIMRRFEEENIEFAYPTQTLYLQNSIKE